MSWPRGVLGVLGLLGACSGAPEVEPAACPVHEPSSCSDSPTYEADVRELFARRCTSCHSAGGLAADRDLGSFAAVRRIGTTVLGQVQGCRMPPPESEAPLTLAERSLVVQWFACGAPER